MATCRGMYFEEFHEGWTVVSSRRTVTEADIVAFAGVSGDFNPLHVDEEFARSTVHGGRIAHGLLTAAISSGLATQTGAFHGTALALVEVEARFVGVVRPGDTLQLTLECVGKRRMPQGNAGLVVLKTTLRNQKGEVVSEGRWKMMVRTSAGDASSPTQ